MKNNKIGMRIIKTAISVFIAVSIYVILLIVDNKVNIEHDNWQAPSNFYTPFFAAIAAAYATHKNSKSSLKQAKIRSFGSIIGGYFAMIIVLVMEFILIDKINLNNTNFILYKLITFAIVSFGIIPLIFITVKFKQKEAVFISCLTYLSVTISIRNGGMPVLQFATNRVLSTIIGVGISLLVNNISAFKHKNKDVLFVTSLNNNFIYDVNHIPDYTKYKLNDLYFRDMALCFVTTRTIGFLEKTFKDVEVNYPMVIMNGSAIYNFDKKTYEHIVNIDNELKHKIDDKLNKFTMKAFIYTINDDIVHCYHKASNLAEINFYETHKHGEGYSFVKGIFPDELGAAYYLIIDETEKVFNLMDEIKSEGLDEYLDLFDQRYSIEGYHSLKINAKDATKDNSVQYLIEKNKLNKLIVCASDYTEIELIERADLSFCLNNAPKHIKALVDVCIDSNEASDILKIYSKLYHSKNIDKKIEYIKKNNCKN